MKYKEAMAIGSAVDGVIKCTWAMIYDADGNRVFSVQKKGTTAPLLFMTEGCNDNVEVDLMTSDSGVVQSVCTCKRFVDGYRVPVQLHANVLGMLKNSLAIEKVRMEMFHKTYGGEYRDLKVKTREKQISDIEAGKEFWVKVKAFEWYPLNTQNVSSEVRKAEADLKRAKQLLAASAVATVI